MTQVLALESPWETPPTCTRPDGPWCESRFLRDDEKVCRASKTCAKAPRAAPAAWSDDEARVLELNSHLDVVTLQFLLPGRGADEIRAKLREVEP